MVSVHSNNPFDLLGDEQDVAAAPAQQKKASDKPAAAAPAKKNVDKTRAQPQERRIRSEYPARGGRTGKSAAPRQEGDARPARGDLSTQEGEERASNKRDHTDRHRGARGGFQAGRGRAFDRRSGGHRDSEKKESQGWGEATANYEDASASPVVEGEAAVEEPKVEDPEVVAAAAEARRLREEEEKQKTLDVYLAEKAKAGPIVALPSGRQANEGADSSQWKDAVVYERVDEEEALFSGKEQTYKKKGKKDAASKTALDIELKFAPVPRTDRAERGERTERGGRGGARGGARGGNRGANRGGERGNNSRGGRSNNERAINMDLNAFPVLGGSK